MSRGFKGGDDKSYPLFGFLLQAVELLSVLGKFAAEVFDPSEGFLLFVGDDLLLREFVIVVDSSGKRC